VTVPSRSPRIGCVYRPQFAPERLAATAAAADRAGLDELWLWEDCFLAGGVSAAAIALSNSSRLTVGVGVLPAPMRNVAATAMEIATLARAFPARVRVGVGHGVQEWMAQIGERVDSPMTLLREYLSCLTALLRGERVTFHGRYVDLEDVALDWPPDPSTEILAAAMGPRTLRLSGELATGTVLTGGTTPDALRSALQHVRAGSALATVSRRHDIVTYVLCSTGPTARQDVLAEIEHWGYDPEDDVAAHGEAHDIAGALTRWTDAGATTVVVQPSAAVDIEEFVTFVGSEVQPLMR
jgi:alkanesulfonate monooxygenase SsuD/methylene tetrahydromethanopterin reductase-like flavin-dependent oxidoreductase (luciferase family)